MALTEKNVYQVEVTEGDNVQVRVKRIILDDGEPISSSLHRHVIEPGDDASGEVGKVRRVVAAAHVPTVVDKHQKRMAIEKLKAERETEEKIKRKAKIVETPAEQNAIEAEHQKAIKALEKIADEADKAHEAFLSSEG